jgi:hypothetical protein
MNAGPFASLISDFAQTWATHRPSLCISLDGAEIEADQNHPLHGELMALCSGHAASLPFFPTSGDIVWCTVAPDSDSLRHAVADLGSWGLPSFGGTAAGDGIIRAGSAKGGLAAKILAASPDGYYRWRCPRPNFDRILDKLRLFRKLRNARPVRAQPPRPSLYELRARFASALLVGDRAGAEDIIEQLDLFQLETAVNTQFMRIRMWHHFGELVRIRDHPDLPHLLAQAIPPRIRTWIDEACGEFTGLDPLVPSIPVGPSSNQKVEAVLPVAPEPTATVPPTCWDEWIDAVKQGRTADAEGFIDEWRANDEADFSVRCVEALCACLDELTLDDALRWRERGLVLAAVSEISERYVREPGFPRSGLAKLYLSLSALWCLLHKGNSAGQEHGHVLLELASALLQLNENPREICQYLVLWWEAKPAPSQLYFALDAIELIERELPDLKPAEELWFGAANVIRRGADSLPPADREIWRRVGLRLGFDAATIAQYLPPETTETESLDPLGAAELKHVAIVCLREKQARQAAQEIESRTAAKVTVITTTVGGGETNHACNADVVLFVWLASTHALFRAFDQYERKKLCYVQGTGHSSIVKALERWIVSQ